MRQWLEERTMKMLMMQAMMIPIPHLLVSLVQTAALVVFAVFVVLVVPAATADAARTAPQLLTMALQTETLRKTVSKSVES